MCYKGFYVLFCFLIGNSTSKFRHLLLPGIWQAAQWEECQEMWKTESRPPSSSMLPHAIAHLQPADPTVGRREAHGFPRHLQANEASIHPGEIWLCVAFHTQGKMSELSGGSWYHRVNSGVCGWIHGDEADEKFLRKCTTCWWRWICWRAPYKAEG